MADLLPSADEFFGQPQQGGELPTADQFFAPETKPSDIIAQRVKQQDIHVSPFSSDFVPQATAAADAFFSQTAPGRVLNAFGHGAKQAWGTESVAIPDPVQQVLKSTGFWDEYANTRNQNLKAFNEVLFRPAAAMLDRFLGPLATDINAVLRAGGAAIGGAAESAYQAGKEVDAPALGREVAGMIEYAGTTGIPEIAFAPRVRAPVTSLPRARTLGVIGEGEKGYAGVRAPEPINEAARAEATRHIMDEQAKAAPEPTGTVPEGTVSPETAVAEAPQIAAEAPSVAVAAPDIHQVARQIAPDTFREYDAVSQRRDTFSRWMRELRETRREQAEADAPYGAEIEDLAGRLDTATPRMRKKYEARLEEMEAEREAFIERALEGETADMARVRADFQKADYRMRDLGPEVAAAYRKARENLPPDAAPPVEAAREAAPTPETAPKLPPDEIPAQIAEPAAEAALEAPTGPNVVGESLGVTTPEHLQAISKDVSKKLTAAGRPKAEADAAGQLIAAHYEARAARFDGERGNAYTLFAKEAPTIRAARQRTKELAQGGKVLNQEPLPEKALTKQEMIARGADGHLAKAYERHIPVEKVDGLEPTPAAAEGKPYVKGQKIEQPIEVAYDAANDKYMLYAGNHRITQAKLNGDEYIIAFVEPDKGKIGESAKRELDTSIRQTDTPEFKKWFGDSKVVDADGQPLRVYKGGPTRHGGPTRNYKGDVIEDAPWHDIDVIDSPGNPWAGFFSDDPSVASRFAEGYGNSLSPENPAAVYAAYVKMDNPFVIDVQGKHAATVQFKSAHEGWDDTAFKSAMNDDRYDGVVLLRTKDEGNVYIPKRPEQIKSATGNRGTFDPTDPNILNQGKKGSITLGNARNTIKLFKDADASTFIHETGHDWLEELFRDAGDAKVKQFVKDDAATVRDWLGVKDGEAIPTKAHEKFARGFERYMMEGVAPSQKLAGVFAKFKDWLTKIYETVQKLRSPINDDIRRVFDRMLAENPEPVIAPEREAKRDMADFHEMEAETIAPEQAAPAADQIRADIDDTVKKIAPEVFDELPNKQAGGIPRADPVPDRGGNAAQLERGPEGEPAQRAEIAESGDVAPKESAPARPGRNEQRVLRRVPKEPERLIDFIKRKGGIKDDRGDIATLVSGDKKALRKLLKEQGESLDEMTRMAWDAGYFPEAAERPTTVEMIEKIGQDYRGEAQYSLHDANAVQNYKTALEYNAEAERLGDELGIRPEDPDFWEKVSDQLSLEEMAAEQKSQAEHFENEFAEAERLAKEYTESRGDAWEPDEVYADASRSLEDLEREHQQEIASRRASQSASGAEDGLAAVDQGQIQEGGGPRSDGAESRQRDQETEPNSSSELFGPLETEFLDKAGNIRLDNLNTPESVNEVIRQIATENGEFLSERRGVITDAEVIDLANDLGMDAGTLDKRKIGEAFNAEQIVAARKLLVKSATNLKELMNKAAQGTDADVMAYAAARDQFIMIQGQVAGITAEAGRALRAFRKLEGQEDAALMSSLIQEETGRTLNQLKQEAARGAQLDTPAKVAKFMNDSQKPSFTDMLLEFWINSLLSGPKTHVKNILGNTFVAINSVAETMVASGVGKVLGSADRVQLGEAKARFFGITQGAKEGISAAKAILDSEDAIAMSSHTIEKANKKAIPGLAGKIIRTPGRALAMEDEIFKAIGYRQELNALAYREASKAGLTGDAFAAKVAQLVTDPPEAMMEAARKNAEYQTFTNSLGPTGRAIQNFANSHFLAKFLVPFIRTPVNLLKFAGERSPLAPLSKNIRATITGPDTVARDTQIARMAIGTSITVAAAALAMEGSITGGGPSDQKQRAALRMTGWSPYSVKVGDMYYSYNWLDPFATIGGITADMSDIVKFGKAKDEEISAIASDLMGSLTKSAASKTSLRGISSFLQMASDPDRYGEGYISSFAAGFVPAIVGQTNQILDPVVRRAETPLDAMKAKIPGMSQDLLPRRDVWGNEMVREGALGPDIASSIYESAVSDDPVNKAMIESGYFPSSLGKKIRGVELSDQQYDDYSRIAGRMAKMQLDTIVRIPGFSNLPALERLTLMRSAVESSRESARSLILLQNPELIQAAIDAKVGVEMGKPDETP